MNVFLENNTPLPPNVQQLLANFRLTAMEREELIVADRDGFDDADDVYLRQSRFHPTQLGVYANRFLPKGTSLGDYMGAHVTKAQRKRIKDKSKLMGIWVWKTKQRKAIDYTSFVDGNQGGNWITLIQQELKDEAKCNVENEQVQDANGTYAIEYITTKDICKGEELVVYNGYNTFQKIRYRALRYFDECSNQKPCKDATANCENNVCVADQDRIVARQNRLYFQAKNSEPVALVVKTVYNGITYRVPLTIFTLGKQQQLQHPLKASTKLFLSYPAMQDQLETLHHTLTKVAPVWKLELRRDEHGLHDIQRDYPDDPTAQQVVRHVTDIQQWMLRHIPELQGATILDEMTYVRLKNQRGAWTKKHTDYYNVVKKRKMVTPQQASRVRTVWVPLHSISDPPHSVLQIDGKKKAYRVGDVVMFGLNVPHQATPQRIQLVERHDYVFALQNNQYSKAKALFLFPDNGTTNILHQYMNKDPPRSAGISISLCPGESTTLRSLQDAINSDLDEIRDLLATGRYDTIVYSPDGWSNDQAIQSYIKTEIKNLVNRYSFDFRVLLPSTMLQGGGGMMHVTPTARHLHVAYSTSEPKLTWSVYIDDHRLLLAETNQPTPGKYTIDLPIDLMECPHIHRSNTSHATMVVQINDGTSHRTSFPVVFNKETKEITIKALRPL